MEKAFIILAQNISQAEISIVACVVGMVLFMKYDQKQKDSSGHKWIGLSLGIGFLFLVGFRIYKGIF